MQADVTILGAGASGLCCAVTCARRGRRVVVLDHGPKAARKVLASGGGRCNCTNRRVTAEDYRCANPHFVKSVLARFGPEALLDWFGQGGLATLDEAGGKVFCRDGGQAMVRFLEGQARQAGAEIRLGGRVAAARRDGAAFVVETEAGAFRSTSLVLALGGLSWPGLGASGLGYELARGLGLAVTALRPGLSPLVAGPDWAELCRELAGVSLPVRLSGPCDLTGELLFTHHGISGPVVLDASLFWRPGDRLTVDVLPGVAVEAALAQAPRLDIKNALARLLPKRLATAFCRQLGLSGPVAGLSARTRREVAERLAAWPFVPARVAGYDKAEVTLGGVETAGISSKTLEAAAVPGLFVVGELLDVTGRLGGFNLHWAFASGLAAGERA